MLTFADFYAKSAKLVRELAGKESAARNSASTESAGKELAGKDSAGTDSTDIAPTLVPARSLRQEIVRVFTMYNDEFKRHSDIIAQLPVQLFQTQNMDRKEAEDVRALILRSIAEIRCALLNTANSLEGVPSRY